MPCSLEHQAFLRSLTPEELLGHKRKLARFARARYGARHPERIKAYRESLKSLPLEDRTRAGKKHRKAKLLSDPGYYARQMKSWKQRNPEKYRVIYARWKRKRYATDPGFRMQELLKACVSRRLRTEKISRSGRVCELLGCTIPGLKAHLESLFAPGMTWENKGRFGWHIDHKRPCSLFDLTDPSQQRACFHYTNLQPLWWRDNLEKRDKCI